MSPSFSPTSLSATASWSSTPSGRASGPSCPLNQRPQGRPASQPLTWEELLGQR